MVAADLSDVSHPISLITIVPLAVWTLVLGATEAIVSNC